MKKILFIILLFIASLQSINAQIDTTKNKLNFFPSFNLSRTYFGVMPYYAQSLGLTILQKNKFSLTAGFSLNDITNSVIYGAFEISCCDVFSKGNYGKYNATQYYLFPSYKINNRISLFAGLSVKETFDGYYFFLVSPYSNSRSDLFGFIGADIDMHNGIFLRFNLNYKVLTLKDRTRATCYPNVSSMTYICTYIHTITPYNILGFGIGYNFLQKTKKENNKTYKKYYMPKNNISLVILPLPDLLFTPLYYERQLFKYNRYALLGGINFCYNTYIFYNKNLSKSLDYGVFVNNKLMILKNTGIEAGIYYKYYESPVNNSDSQLVDFLKTDYLLGFNYGLNILVKKHYVFKIKHGLKYFNYDGAYSYWQELNLSVGYAFGY